MRLLEEKTAEFQRTFNTVSQVDNFQLSLIDWHAEEKATTRKQELESELQRKNADLKRIMDLLRNMLNDIGMWDCCGKSALQGSN